MGLVEQLQFLNCLWDASGDGKEAPWKSLDAAAGLVSTEHYLLPFQSSKLTS